jgi:DNA-binding SARP family transcriptional activator
MAVRRPDGSWVRPDEWRTGKAMDLLRLLALDVGRPVPAARLVALLWPDVDAERGGTSLRTAAYRLRKVVGFDCVTREQGGLVLQHAWVDTAAYGVVADAVADARRTGDHAEALRLVRLAEALYVDDIAVPEASGDWLLESSAGWRGRRMRVLLDGADSAARLRLAHDSRALAEAAHRLDAQSETAARALMRALAALGEVRAALSVFERLRTHLARDLGVDPSSQTRALHLQLLTGADSADDQSPAGTQDDVVDRTLEALSRLRHSGLGRGVLLLRGASGSGRASVLEEACKRVGLRLRELGAAGEGVVGPVRSVAGAPASLAARVLLLPAADVVSDRVLDVYLDLSARTGSLLALPAESAASDLLGHPTGQGRPDVEVVDVPRLTRDELWSLSREVLQGAPAAGLLRELEGESDGLAGRAVAVLRGWLDADRVVWTDDGLDLVPTPETRALPLVGPAHALRALSTTELDVLTIVAATRTALSADEVRAVRAACFPGQLDGQVDDTAEVLRELASRGLVEAGPGGVRLSRLAPRQQILDRVRPDLRRSLRSRLADGVEPDEPGTDHREAAHHVQARRVREGRISRLRSEAGILVLAAPFADLFGPLLAG